MKHFVLAAALAALAPSCVWAEAVTPATPAATCAAGSPLAGSVRDNTAALIPGASLTLDGGKPVVSGSDGRFRFPCVSNGKHKLSVSADGFATHEVLLNSPRTGELNVTLELASVQSEVTVSVDQATVADTVASGPTQTISGDRLQSLADDPDDLLRELQQMAASAGGSPSNSTIAVDGFANDEGTTKLPPKSSIAYIKVNPDLFSAEYRNPPFGGGRIEIYTKPGADKFHGALFATNGSSWMNARDPFSTSKAALGKQRYGFELSGPILKKGSDFSMNLEHRSIDNVAVVNAIDVNASGVQTPIVQNVATPQQLWQGELRVDWQLGPKNTFIATFDANANHQQNLGVGGTSLASTGYDEQDNEYNLHFTDITTINAKLMHEARVAFEFDRNSDNPISTAPQISLAGAFTGGGAANGQTHAHSTFMQIEDDAILNLKKHLMKAGLQTEFVFDDLFLRTNFNGSYSYGGGLIPGTTQSITGIQQYVRALNGQPGGTPTVFSNVAGNPEEKFTIFRGAIYYQDDWKLRDNLKFSYGLRYFSQTNPDVHNDFTPRLGIAWSPDKKATWTLHAHAGTFAGRFRGRDYMELVREDGVNRITSTVYNPACTGISTAVCDPLAGATAIHSQRTVQPGFGNEFWAAENIGFTHSFPHGWNLSGDYYQAQIWHASRTENINAPLNGSPTGPRPLAPNVNIFQVQNSGRGYGNVEFVGLEQHTLKHVQFFIGSVREWVVDDNDDSMFYTPQTTGVNRGEYARRDTDPLWHVFGNALVKLPAKLQLSGNLQGGGLQKYNVTTGFDNNGDGDFNDRPQYAPAGTPLCSATVTSNCAYATPWGNLVTSGGAASLPRDKGTMPWTVYLDMNLQRTFRLTRDPKNDHPQTLSANIRSSNVLNHRNVTSVGTVIGSPLFGVAYAADPGRRVEAGLRYTF